jgi:hypothetical protein
MQNKPLVNINSWAILTLSKDGYSSREGKKALKKSRNPKGLRLSGQAQSTSLRWYYPDQVQRVALKDSQKVTPSELV